MSTLSELCGEPLLDTLVIDMAGLLRRLGFERDGIAVGLTKPLIRRQFLLDHAIEYDTNPHVVEDYWMLADCVAAGARFVMIPDAYYYYRLHAQHTTSAAESPRDIASTRARLQAFLDGPVAAVEPRRRARQGDPFAFDPLSGGHRSREKTTTRPSR
jgi:succinoglycan biosynthesis protein ExoO